VCFRRRRRWLHVCFGRRAVAAEVCVYYCSTYYKAENGACVLGGDDAGRACVLGGDERACVLEDDDAGRVCVFGGDERALVTRVFWDATSDQHVEPVLSRVFWEATTLVARLFWEATSARVF